MRAFEYRRLQSAQATAHAAKLASTSIGGRSAIEIPARRAVQFIAGGTNMVDYMTLGVATPSVLLDINHLEPSYSHIQIDERRVRLGALVRMADAEDHPVIRTRFPIVSQSLMLAASRQIRNMASLGGNVLQRTRCEYFREISWPCNKRTPGAGCAALEGINRQHAVLGTSEQCIATYAGDFAQALIALEAVVETIGHPSGARRLPFANLHLLPGTTPHLETALAPGELITFIEIPSGPWTQRSRYLKVRDRDSYQFALASAAVALHLEGEIVRAVRIALGGVATVPWRAHAAEMLLTGNALDESLAEKAANAAFVDARSRGHNGFKIALGKRTLVRALMEVRAMETPT